jgi:hypothetical protein
MAVTYTGDKGEPELVASGSPPTFVADVAEVVEWFQKGRTFRREETQSALDSATGMEDLDLAQVDAIPGAWFKYDGSAGDWVMHGVAVFDDATARDAAITAPAAGMLSRLEDTDTVWRYKGSAWVELHDSGLVFLRRVPFTGENNIVMDDLFSQALARNYKGIWKITNQATADSSIRLVMRDGGVDYTTTSQINRLMAEGTGSPTGSGTTSNGSLKIGRADSTGGSGGSFEILAPAHAEATILHGWSHDTTQGETEWGQIDNSNTFEGAKLVSDNNITGFIDWYAYVGS